MQTRAFESVDSRLQTHSTRDILSRVPRSPLKPAGSYPEISGLQTSRHTSFDFLPSRGLLRYTTLSGETTMLSTFRVPLLLPFAVTLKESVSAALVPLQVDAPWMIVQDWLFPGPLVMAVPPIATDQGTPVLKAETNEISTLSLYLTPGTLLWYFCQFAGPNMNHRQARREGELTS